MLKSDKLWDLFEKLSGYLIVFCLGLAVMLYSIGMFIIMGVTNVYLSKNELFRCINKNVLIYEIFKFIAFNILIMSYYLENYSYSIFYVSMIVYVIYLALVMLRSYNGSIYFKLSYDKYYDIINRYIKIKDENIEKDRKNLIKFLILVNIYLIASSLFFDQTINVLRFLSFSIVIYIYFDLNMYLENKLVKFNTNIN